MSAHHADVGVVERDRASGSRRARARPSTARPARCRASTTTLRWPTPGSSVASTTVRPLATERRVIRPADNRTSACSPGRSIVARAAPACGTGSTNEARPGGTTSGPPHSSVERKRARPGDQRVQGLTIGDERHRPPAGGGVDERRARQQRHAVDAGLQHLAGQVEDAARDFAIDRDRRSALATTAGTGAATGGTGARAARSSRRLYSASGMVTDRGWSAGRAGVLRGALRCRRSKTTSVVRSIRMVMTHLLRSGES